MKYVKGGKIYKGSKPSGMSDDEYHKTMLKKGWTLEKAEALAPAKFEKAAEQPEVGDEVEVSELTKALDQLTNLVKGNDPASRKEELLQKSLQGGELEAEERAELMNLIGGGEEDGGGESLSKSATASLDPEDDETIAKSIEVSEYLRVHHKGTVDGLSVLADTLEKAQAQTNEFNLTLAKAIVQVGRGLEEFQKSVESWSSQPLSSGRAARNPKQAKAQAIQKSFAGTAPEGSKLSKSQVMDLMESMNRRSESGLSPSGEDMTQAIAKYESSGRMSKSLYNDLQSFVAQQRGAA